MWPDKEPTQWLETSSEAEKFEKFSFREFSKQSHIPLASFQRTGRMQKSSPYTWLTQQQKPQTLLHEPEGLAHEISVRKPRHVADVTKDHTPLYFHSTVGTSGSTFSIYHQEKPKHLFDDSEQVRKLGAFALDKLKQQQPGAYSRYASHSPVKSRQQVGISSTDADPSQTANHRIDGQSPEKSRKQLVLHSSHAGQSPGKSGESSSKGGIGKRFRLSNIWMNIQNKPRHIVDGQVELPSHKAKKNHSAMVDPSKGLPAPQAPDTVVVDPSSESHMYGKFLLEVDPRRWVAPATWGQVRASTANETLFAHSTWAQTNASSWKSGWRFLLGCSLEVD